MCDVEVHQDSTVRYGHDGDACERARSGESPLFAVWPGQWSSDMFAIDDLGAGPAHHVAPTMTARAHTSSRSAW